MLTINKLYEHLNWANKRILQTLESVEHDPTQNHNQDLMKTIELFAHILQAEQVWLARLQGKASTRTRIWPEADLAICTKLVIENATKYDTYLTTLLNKDIDSLISYTNQSGVPFETSIRDILTHVALHGQYHRGQINAKLRSIGAEPASVDYIVFVR